MVTHYRKVIKIRALDSPNVRMAMAQQAAGKPVTGEVLVPGVLTWQDYQIRLATWDVVRRTIGLDGDFYLGAEVLLFPPEWLNISHQRWREYKGRVRKAEAIGIDPAEGGDKTTMAAVDSLGLIELVSAKTPDTSVIRGQALAFMQRHNVPPSKVCMDRGGGGKQIADELRASGHPIVTIAFGENLMPDPVARVRVAKERMDIKEERYIYFNRRAEMYGTLSELMEPIREDGTFTLPDPQEGEPYAELRRQLSVIPKTYDREGRLKLLPKNKNNPDSTEKTLIELIGHSPDEADAVVLAVHGMVSRKQIAPARAF